MKFTLFILILLFTSCNWKNDSEKLSQMKPPIIVSAITFNQSGSGCILLKDSTGCYVVMNMNSVVGAALIKSYQKGDTLK